MPLETMALSAGAFLNTPLKFKKFNSSPLKNDGKGDQSILSFSVSAYFQGRAVKLLSVLAVEDFEWKQ